MGTPITLHLFEPSLAGKMLVDISYVHIFKVAFTYRMCHWQKMDCIPIFIYINIYIYIYYTLIYIYIYTLYCMIMKKYIYIYIGDGHQSAGYSGFRLSPLWSYGTATAWIITLPQSQVRHQLWERRSSRRFNCILSQLKLLYCVCVFPMLTLRMGCRF